MTHYANMNIPKQREDIVSRGKQLEILLEGYDLNTHWKQKNGEIIAYKDMNTTHLQRVTAMLNSNIPKLKKSIKEWDEALYSDITDVVENIAIETSIELSAQLDKTNRVLACIVEELSTRKGKKEVKKATTIMKSGTKTKVVEAKVLKDNKKLGKDFKSLVTKLYLSKEGNTL